jgi:hypothetical protein
MIDLGLEFAIVLTMMVVVGTLLRERWQITPFWVSTLEMSLVLIGFITLDQRNHSIASVSYVLAFTSMAAGYQVRRLVRPKKLLVFPALISRHYECLLGLFIIILGFTAYHFAIVGFPVFSADPEVARFGFSDSGLFGIPGRMYLFGVPFLVLACASFSARFPSPSSQRLSTMAWAIYICVNVLSAFKGALLDALLMVFLTASIKGKPVHLFRTVNTGRLLLLVGAGLYASVLTMSYLTLGYTSITDIATYASQRMTVGSAEPGYLVLQEFRSDRVGEYFLSDVRYFAGKYFSFLGIKASPYFPLDLTVSAQLYGTPLSTENLIVPVTVGLFPECVANFGVATAVAVMFVIGVAYATLYIKARNARSPFVACMTAFAIYMLQRCIVKGGLAYFIMNYALMAGLLTLVYVVVGHLLSVVIAAPRQAIAGAPSYRGPVTARPSRRLIR